MAEPGPVAVFWSGSYVFLFALLAGIAYSIPETGSQVQDSAALVVGPMFAARKLVVGLLCLVLASCQPTMLMSIYNNSGRDLIAEGVRGKRLAWKAGEYLTVHSTLNDIFKLSEKGELALDVSDAEGRSYRYLMDQEEADKTKALYYLWYFRATANAKTEESVAPVARSGAIHLRIDPDMALYWFGDFDGVEQLGDAPIPEQPGIFPVRPMSRT